MRRGTPVPETGVVPVVRYNDTSAAINWLCRVLQLKLHRIATDAEGTLQYAELTLGNGMVMLAPRGSALDKFIAQPNEVGGVATQTCYFFVRDVRAHFARAKQAGADIVFDLRDEGTGWGYSCRDCEGHLWNFGSYDPWHRRSGVPGRSPFLKLLSAISTSFSAVLMLLLLLMIFSWGNLSSSLLGAMALNIADYQSWQSRPQLFPLSIASASERTASEVPTLATPGASNQRDQDEVLQEALAALVQARSEKRAKEKATEEARAQIVGEHTARKAAERALIAFKDKLDVERQARLAAERQLARERLARKRARRSWTMEFW